MISRGAALIAVVALACGGSAAGGGIDRSGSLPSQSGSSNEPTVWNAINQSHSDVVLLQCRGGAGFEFKSLGFKPTPQGDVRVAVAMTFAANPQAAGDRNQNLAPGTCAAADRPLTASEPHELHFVTAAFSQVFVGPIDVTPAAAEYHPDVRSIAAYLKDPGRYWTFNAADTHRGYLDAWVHQYWKDFGVASRPQGPADQAAGDAGPWLVRITFAGGLAGAKREISVNAAGHLQANSTSGNVRCSAELASPSVQSLEAALARSHPETWRAAYVRQGNPNGCCDQIKVTMHVEQKDAQNRVTNRETYWFNESAAMVPEGVTALFKMVYDSRNACSQVGF